MPKRLLIIYTGGTIGMKQTAKGLAPAGDLTAEISQLIEIFRDLQRGIDVEVNNAAFTSPDYSPERVGAVENSPTRPDCCAARWVRGFAG
jgi:L-asparaginase/Glu-tRNA(Gln) amidotransferase subunit D